MSRVKCACGFQLTNTHTNVHARACTHTQKKNYPKMTRVIARNEEDLYALMRDAKCKGAITFNQYWHQYLNKKVVNAVEGKPRCQIVSPAGSRFFSGEGGFAVKADAGGKDGRCSSLVREVLDLHMNEMWNDGFVQKALESFFNAQSEIHPPCVSEGAAQSLSSDTTTRVQGMAGTFIIHCAFSILAVIVSLLARYIQPPTTASQDCEETAEQQVKEDHQKENEAIKTILAALDEQSKKLERLTQRIESVDENVTQMFVQNSSGKLGQATENESGNIETGRTGIDMSKRSGRGEAKGAQDGEMQGSGKDVEIQDRGSLFGYAPFGAGARGRGWLQEQFVALTSPREKTGSPALEERFNVGAEPARAGWLQEQLVALTSPREKTEPRDLENHDAVQADAHSIHKGGKESKRKTSRKAKKRHEGSETEKGNSKVGGDSDDTTMLT